MKHIQFDNAGELCGRYDSAIHGDAVPPDAVEVSDDLFWQTINETDGVWKRDPVTGEISKYSLPPSAPEQIEADKVAIVQRHMDEAARALRYDSIANAVTYAEEPAVPKFQAEGQALRAWRSLVWEKCYEILDEVRAGDRGIPTDEELINELPTLEAP